MGLKHGAEVGHLKLSYPTMLIKYFIFFWPLINRDIKHQEDFKNHMATQDSKSSAEPSLSRTDGEPEKYSVSENNTDCITEAREEY